jgi:hypothetical protein
MPTISMQYRRDHVRKVCGCPRRKWGSCRHPWHFAYFFKRPYRFSLDKFLGRHLETFEGARREAHRIRQEIWGGTFVGPDARGRQQPSVSSVLTFTSFAETWKTRVGSTLVSGKIHGYRLGGICAFPLPGSDPVLTFGDKPLERITTDDIEAFRDARKAAGLSAWPSIMI